MHKKKRSLNREKNKQILRLTFILCMKMMQERKKQLNTEKEQANRLTQVRTMDLKERK